MEKVRFTVVITVLNEEGSLGGWLDSVSGQSVLPDEVVVVDGGSRDKTKEVYKVWAKGEKRFVHSFLEHEGNRSVGRNVGITLAKGEIILVSDAGCRLDREWVKLMIKLFEEEVIDVVAGNYTIERDVVDVWGLVGYQLTANHPKSVKDSAYLGSSRSLGFRKKVWDAVGGYPEELPTAEDLVFAKKIQGVGRQVSAPKALVYWRPASGFLPVLRVFYGYAYGDGVAGSLSPHGGRYVAKLVSLVGLVGLVVVGRAPWWGAGILVLTYAWLQTFRQLSRSDYVGGSIKESLLFLHALLLLIQVLFVVTLVGYLHGRGARVGSKVLYATRT